MSGLDSRQLLACKKQPLSLHWVSLQRVYTGWFTQGVQVRQQAAAGLQKTVSVFTLGVFTEGVYTGWFTQGVFTLGGFTQGVRVRQQAAAGLQNTVTVFTQGLCRGCFYTRWFTQGVFTEGVHWVVLHRVFRLDSRQLLAHKTQSLSLHRVFTEGVFTLGGLHRVSLQRVFTGWFYRGCSS